MSEAEVGMDRDVSGRLQVLSYKTLKYFRHILGDDGHECTENQAF